MEQSDTTEVNGVPNANEDTNAKEVKDDTPKHGFKDPESMLIKILSLSSYLHVKYLDILLH